MTNWKKLARRGLWIHFFVLGNCFALLLWAFVETALLLPNIRAVYASGAFAMSTWLVCRMVDHIGRIRRYMRAQQQLDDNLAQMPHFEMRHVKDRGITYRQKHPVKKYPR